MVVLVGTMPLQPHNGNLNAPPARLKLRKGRPEASDSSLYQALIEHAPVGFMVLKPESGRRTFRIVAANPAIIAITRFKDLQARELVGKVISEVFPSICTKDLDQALAEAAHSGTASHLGQLQHGEQPDPENTFSIQAFGLPDGCLGLVFETITERKRAEEALRILETGFLDYIETAADAMLLCDIDGKILLANAQTEKLFGYSRAQLFHQPIESLITEGFRERHLSNWTDHLTQLHRRRMASRLEVMVRRADNIEFPAEISLSAFNTEAGLRVCAAIRDLTERKRAEQALVQAAEELTRSNTELDQFANAASHDLQEPLRTISGLTQLLVLDYSERLDAQGRTYLSAVTDSARRMQSLLEGLLKYSRVGAQHNTFELVDCEEACDAAVADLRLAFEQSQAVLTREPLPTVPGVRTQLIQLFQNLLANAIKFRGPNIPRIHISAQQRDREWVIAVRDNGIGIDPEKFEQIFLLFRRLHGREEYPGTGIGLALCRKIVAQHGGRIWVESAPGAGAVFFFSLRAANRPCT